MINNKARGNRAEREIVHLMQDWGYEAIGSKASRGAADVIAWNDEEIRFIQSKNESRKGAYTEDLERLKKMKCPPNGKRELWIRQRGRSWIRKTIMNDGTITEDRFNA